MSHKHYSLDMTYKHALKEYRNYDYPQTSYFYVGSQQ